MPSHFSCGLKLSPMAGLILAFTLVGRLVAQGRMKVLMVVPRDPGRQRMVVEPPALRDRRPGILGRDEPCRVAAGGALSEDARTNQAALAQDLMDGPAAAQHFVVRMGGNDQYAARHHLHIYKYSFVTNWTSFSTRGNDTPNAR